MSGHIHPLKSQSIRKESSGELDTIATRALAGPSHRDSAVIRFIAQFSVPRFQSETFWGYCQLSKGDFFALFVLLSGPRVTGYNTMQTVYYETDRQTETQRETETERKRDRDRETDTQTHREWYCTWLKHSAWMHNVYHATDTQRDRRTHRQTHRHRERENNLSETTVVITTKTQCQPPVVKWIDL